MRNNVLVIDNYDSFTYNLVHTLNEIRGEDVLVIRNDAIDFEVIEQIDSIILSPGPGIPNEAGDLKRVIREQSGKKKILGVCLGHQAIGETFGGTLQNLNEVYHGVQTKFYLTENRSPIFEGIEDEFDAGRYHSWVIEKNSLPNEFQITCTDEKGEIMAIQHETHPIYGVQFHPESVMTPQGKIMLKNFLNLD